MQTAFHIQPTLAEQVEKLLGPEETRKVMLSAADVTSIESKWKRKWAEEMERVTTEILVNASETGRLAFGGKLDDFDDLVMEHSLDTMRKALDHSIDFLPRVPETHLASPGPPPRARVPTSFRQLRIMWDRFRKKKVIPPRQRALAERIRRQYLKTVQDVWVKHGEEFRQGTTAERREAVSAILKGAEVPYARAKMIVETETTYYYNKTRKAVFDQSSDVTHYLFLAIRDHRTTEWCKTRHGLVYAKSDPLLAAETPPVHWNCRSEILPLVPQNPRHLKLIQDSNRWRRHNTCKPLPAEWGAR